MCSLSCNRIVYKGLMKASQMAQFYQDMREPEVASAFAMVHSRFSTNTLGAWPLAHPYRMICHNGEINTLRGNINFMHARSALFESPLFGDDMEKLKPIIGDGQSDTASLDNALELLCSTGRWLPHAILMLIPEAWGDHIPMLQEKRDFYEYHACLMEPWDGPAMVAFTDGHSIGAILDRNGLRPMRYLVTNDDVLVMASETGVLDVPPESVRFKSRLQPGNMFYIDFDQGRIIEDAEIKHTLATRQPYGEWLRGNVVGPGEPAGTAPRARRRVRYARRAAARLRLHDGGARSPHAADGRDGAGTRRLHGQRRRARHSVGPAAAAVQLLQAASSRRSPTRRSTPSGRSLSRP